MKKIIKKIILGTVFFIFIFVFVIGMIFLFNIYTSKSNGFTAMQELSTGKSVDSMIYLNDHVYVKSMDDRYDSEKYLFKGIDENNAYHIVTSKNKFLATLSDFVVYSSIDDPLGYIITSEKDYMGGISTYYSESIENKPNYIDNDIRQLMVVFSPVQYPSSGYTATIKDKETIMAIIDLIDNNENPYEIISATVEMRNEKFKIWIDYSDFPMYELIFSN